MWTLQLHNTHGIFIGLMQDSTLDVGVSMNASSLLETGFGTQGLDLTSIKKEQVYHSILGENVCMCCCYIYPESSRNSISHSHK